jgi:alkaline phosphatase D
MPSTLAPIAPVVRPRFLARANVAAIVLAIVGLLAAGAAAARMVVMHGYADLTSATLWIQADAPGPVRVSWRPDGEKRDRQVALVATATEDNVVVARLTGLKPGAGAAYRVEAGAERREGTLRAQPFWTRAADAQTLTFAIGSCFFLADPDPRWGGAGYGGGYEIFAAIAAQAPDLMLWLGDNVYLQQPDFFDPAAMATRYRRQRAFEPLQALLTASVHIAIWDDHDYGPNDGNASYPLKGETLRLFRRYWPNPSLGLPDVPGTFGMARYGDVFFFLLDDRYYRSPNRWPDGPDKSMFGARQLEWLKQALLTAPREALKIVAGGSQFFSRGHRFEGWHHFATERDAFAEWLVAQKIEGLIFLSGDRHFSELLRITRPGAYPIHEFTSSPLTSRPPGKIDDAEHDNPDVVPGTLVLARQFGLIRVSGSGTDRQVALESRDTTGALLWRHEIAARDLRFPRE